MKKKKAVLAFSGGLDTTYCAIYLSKVKDWEVHAVTINTGGFTEEEIDAIAAHAKKLGVASYTCLNEELSFYSKVVKYLIFGNVLKNNTYPLSVSAERIVQAVAVAEYAKQMNADAVVHGSTGAGNDQVRFDMIFNALIPEIEISTPIRDQTLSREAEIEFLKANGVEMNFEKAQYSINKGLWGTSVGGKETLTSSGILPDSAYPTQLSTTTEATISLGFEKGELHTVNSKRFSNPVEAIKRVQELAEPFAIGRDVHVGDTIIGIKGRVGFEAAAPMIVIKSHHLLEKHTLTKWQTYWKDQLSSWYGNWLHEGQYLDPVMRNMEQFIESTQETVTGTVFVTLKPYQFTVTGCESAFDLMSPDFGSYGEMNKAWTGEDVKGFTRIAGNQTAIYHKIRMKNESPKS
jgi:argininosuccinate synthase